MRESISSQSSPSLLNPMGSLELSLRHLAWSNQKFFALFEEMPDSVFGLRAAEGEWPVGRLLTRLAGSGEWYRYCFNGELWTDFKEIPSTQHLSENSSFHTQTFASL